MENYQNLIDEICKEKEIKVTTVSNNWIKILEKDNKINYIAGYYFALNSLSISKILDDKFALYDVLNHFQIPIIKHHLLYKTTPYKNIETLFYKYNKNIIVKPNLGSGGRNVFRITDIADLNFKLKDLFINNYSISLCPYYEIKREYRAVVIDNEIELLYFKIKPEVIGDGKKTINELLREFNPSYFNEKNISQKVLPKGEKFLYNWQFNLSKGASSSLDVDKSKKQAIKKIVKDILAKLPFKFCTVDIIETEKNELLVLEINSSVSLAKFMTQHKNGKDIAKKIYTKAIDLAFNNYK